MTNKKNVVVFYYDRFAEFEIALALLYFNNHTLQAAGLENREYSSMEGQRFLTDVSLSQLNPDTIDLFLIPGGNPVPLLANKELTQFISRLDQKKAIIAGICGGADILVSLGLLRGKKCTGNALDPDNPESLKASYENTVFIDQLVVRDGNFITAQSEGYTELAEVLASALKEDR